MQVLKFGGTSMGDEDTWRKVLHIIKGYERPVVIVSATSRTTRQLIAAAEKALISLDKAKSMADDIGKRHRNLIGNFMAQFTKQGIKVTKNRAQCDRWITNCVNKLKTQLEHISDKGNVTPRCSDAIASIGEQLSSKLLVQAAAVYGIAACWVDARKVIKTNSKYGKAEPQLDLITESVKSVEQKVQKGSVPIMGGFYGEEPNGNITTLGFEGSDLSASLVGAALEAETIEIWTDVSGIYSCDPRLIEGAASIPALSYRQASDLAYFGAKVLHPDTMNPAKEKNIPIWVRNIFEPQHPGTRIGSVSKDHGYAKAMTVLKEKDITVIHITISDNNSAGPFRDSLAHMLKSEQLPIYAIDNSGSTMKVAFKNSPETPSLLKSLQAMGKIRQLDGLAAITLMGCNAGAEEVERLKEIVSQNTDNSKAEIFCYSKDKTILTILLPEGNIRKTIATIHQYFIDDERSKSTGQVTN
jgi:aspartate kinase